MSAGRPVPGTLVVYEEPAARHLIEEWRRGEPRIVDWAVRTAWGYEAVTMASGEVLLVVPAVDGALRAEAAWNAAQEALRPTGFIGKLLCFGKVPALDRHFDHFLHLAKEAAAEDLARAAADARG